MGAGEDYVEICDVTFGIPGFNSQADVVVAELLLTEGADINAKSNHGDTPSRYFWFGNYLT